MRVPLDYIQALEQIVLVMKAGTVYVKKFGNVLTSMSRDAQPYLDANPLTAYFPRKLP